MKKIKKKTKTIRKSGKRFFLVSSMAVIIIIAICFIVALTMQPKVVKQQYYEGEFTEEEFEPVVTKKYEEEANPLDSLLIDISQNMMDQTNGANSFVKAAVIINKNSELLSEAFQKSPKQLQSFKSLVFNSENTVYYGETENGIPNGKGGIIHVYKMDGKDRFDYSIGTWTDGKMIGEGETGYYYFDEKGRPINDGDSSNNAISFRKGSFIDDCFNGDVSLSVYNADDGSTFTYSYTVDNGSPIVDERWISDRNDESLYMLRSNEGQYNYLTINPGITDKNRVPWTK